MATENPIPADQLPQPEEIERPLTEAASKLVLASIGGVALAKDGLEDLLKKMVERGEKSQKEARLRMEKLRAKGPKFSRSGVRDLTDSVRDAAELPSKADIQGLHDQIAELAAKMEQLTKEKAETAIPTPPKASTRP